LGFIDDEDDGAALAILLEKKQVEGIQGTCAIRGGRNTEFPVYILKKLWCCKAGIEDEGRPVMICVELAQKCPQDRCLPGSNFSCQTDESHAMINAVKKVRKGFLMRFAQEDEAGVGGQVKRFLPKPIEVEIHLKIPLILLHQ
jgi:hypothetical protein